MLTVIYEETRTNTDHEWWHFTPEVQSWLDPFEKEMIDKGVMISCVNKVSEDGLTFIRTSIFETREQLISLYTQIPYFDYQQQRSQYNAIYMHTAISDEIES